MALAPLAARAGLTPVINARGAYTDLGGSRWSPGVVAAVLEANSYFADMPELLDDSGAEIARLLDVEAARVVPGASAALALATAACMTDGDGEGLAQLPDATGLKGQAVIQAGHRYKYDRCIAMAGAELVVAGGDGGTSEDDLAAALGPDTAAVFVPAHLDGEPGTLPLETVVALAREADVPTVVDAAYMVSPTSLMGSYVRRGADLACFSAKYYGGPNAGGLVCGSADLVRKLAAADFTRFESGDHLIYGRAFKLDRQTVVAVVEALREWLELDQDARYAEFGRRAEPFMRALPPGTACEPMHFTMEEDLEPGPTNCVVVHCDSGEAAAAVERTLWDEVPRILVVRQGADIAIVFETLDPEEDDVIAQRLGAALAGAAAGEAA